MRWRHGARAVLGIGVIAALVGCGGATYRTGGGDDESWGEAEEGKRWQQEARDAQDAMMEQVMEDYEAQQTYEAERDLGY